RGRGWGRMLRRLPWGGGLFMFQKPRTSPECVHKLSEQGGETEDEKSGTEDREEKDSAQPTTDPGGKTAGEELDRSLRKSLKHPALTPSATRLLLSPVLILKAPSFLLSIVGSIS
uniref:Uncharacterized protein n=1 Tax=Oryctolagus cuniculus TaxID=9986 RepID=A0A5F9C327_RABIT